MKKKSVAASLLRAAEVFDLPGEIISGISRIEITGGREIMIENHGGILEYGENEIQVNGGSVIIVIRGAELDIRSMTATEMAIRGQVFGLEFKY
jgi:sporulation protein YqfC